MRQSNRDGITAVTFDTVAAEAGATRGGMLYRVASRDALIQAINQHLTVQWGAALLQRATRPTYASP